MDTIKKEYHNDMESQIQYAARKYGGNLPPSVAKIHARVLAINAMKTYDKTKGNVKTYLNKHLQKLSRIGYKASSPLIIPESRLMGRAKIRDFSEEHIDTHGTPPSPEEISKGTGISIRDIEGHMAESFSLSPESGFDNIKGSGRQGLSGHDIVQSLPRELRGIGEDVYIHERPEKEILKRHGIKRTAYFAKKKDIDSFIRQNSGLSNTERR